MNIEEYKKVNKMNYLEYCDYLQGKYGIGKCAFMTQSWYKKRCTRTDEGLVTHHKYEDHAIMLSTPKYAKNNPYEWQMPGNLVYCDYLEHLLLHILICENPPEDSNPFEAVGIGGAMNYLIPELNDVYSGWKTSQSWRQNCHDLIIKDKDVYMVLLERFKKFLKDPRRHDMYKRYTPNDLYRCLQANVNHDQLFYEIKNLK